jgi:hypothetical protein
MLGTFSFTQGSPGRIEIFSTGAAGGVVLADAVKLVYVPEPATLRLLSASALVLLRKRT